MYILKRAFSLVELLVTTAIISMIMSVVLWNYSDFNDSLALSASTQEIALAIRQSQTYGINVKETAAGSEQFNSAFGIYFNTSSPSVFRIFVDSDNDNMYDTAELVETVTLRDGVTILSICDSTVCPPTAYPNATGVNVTFLRPNPDARIYFTDSSGNNISGAVTTGRIRLRSRKGNYKHVIVENTGQVTIQ